MEYIFLFIYFVYGLDDEANNDEGENSINLNLMILYNFIQIVSHASHTPLKLTNCHACPASHRSGDEFARENVKTSQLFL